MNCPNPHSNYGGPLGFHYLVGKLSACLCVRFNAQLQHVTHRINTEVLVLPTWRSHNECTLYPPNDSMMKHLTDYSYLPAPHPSSTCKTLTFSVTFKRPPSNSIESPKRKESDCSLTHKILFGWQSHWTFAVLNLCSWYTICDALQQKVP